MTRKSFGFDVVRKPQSVAPSVAALLPLDMVRLECLQALEAVGAKTGYMGVKQGPHTIVRRLRGCSEGAQVKAAAAHLRRLKRNQRKRKPGMTSGKSHSVSLLKVVNILVRRMIFQSQVEQEIFMNHPTEQEPLFNSPGLRNEGSLW